MSKTSVLAGTNHPSNSIPPNTVLRVLENPVRTPEIISRWSKVMADDIGSGAHGQWLTTSPE